MQSTELACPHCGSTLNFGGAIAVGTPVECLICMQTFRATPMAAPSPVPVKTNVATSSSAQALPTRVAVNRPHPAPDSVGTRSPTNRRVAPSAPGGKSVFLLVAVSLGIFLSGGIGWGIWKIAHASRSGSSATIDQPVALSSAPKSAIDAENKTSVLPAAPEIAKPAVDDPENNDVRKPKDADKKLLARKAAAPSGGKELEFDPISTINVPQITSKIAGLDQEKINAAIAKGVAFLKSSQRGTGSWSVDGSYNVGYASLGGLTLLECKVPPADAAVQRTAFFVRSRASQIDMTYELALAILFLDRLGEARDRPLIQGMALRLLASQTEGGGWSYHCRALTTPEMYQLYSFLQSNKKPNLLKGIPAVAKGPSLLNPLDPKSAKMNDPFQELSNLIAGTGDGMEVKDPPPAGKTAPVVVKPTPAKSKTPIRPEMLTPQMRNLAVVRNQGKAKGMHWLHGTGGDNSNTQFALLALWAARRHDIPSDHALIAAYQRFIAWQNNDDFGWPYVQNQRSTPSMTCVGLLGLAMGHGVAPDFVRVDPKEPKNNVVQPALQDPKIRNGLKALARKIGEPSLDKTRTTFSNENLYFLWSVERVAMLYDLKTIENKDWYGWGAQILVHNQNAPGDWPSANFHGTSPHVNTCFALLFLNRSNLVQDLTNGLRLYTAIRDPEK